ncbi:class I SAM-dependent methyltransferase [Viridibacillus sp. YIM B01967]|uniref:Class I SAM-dependent methyltransferase n=1 Tax=Viridibacillus soli TaxID=2798301 RepID=A0ABS1H726_9BACL|nr:class I SAM-dependent methyltransferase [Viridibacillus soli]MBK3495104.1 class I SAM-dependent methyltransferase [Viridibacillus soli]
MHEITTIVTTAARPDALSKKLAEQACDALNVHFVERKKRGVAKMAAFHNANVIVAGKNRYEYYKLGADAPFFFHPSSAAFRLKRAARGEIDTFLAACQLNEGDTFLDCTLGMATDSMMAAFAVGESGKVIGCEGNANVAFIVSEGMKRYDITNLPLLSCMEQIEVVHSVALDYLKLQPDNSFDVVYMDPMFEETIEESTNFQPLRQAGLHEGLSDEWMEQAKRVAKKRIVLKAHFKSDLFERYGFIHDVRLSSKFHYGVLELT